MQLIKPHGLLVLLILAACGPEVSVQEESNWMLGTWSDQGVGFETNECVISHIKIEKNGKAFRGGSVCGAGPTYPTELTWERDGEDAIILHFPEDEHYDGWRLFVGERPPKGPECNALSVENILEGVHYEGGMFIYGRGAVCTEKLGPCSEGQGSCEDYRTVWCDEPPEKCENVFPCSCS